MRLFRLFRLSLLSAFCCASALSEVQFDKTMAWSAYNLGTTGYNQSVAIGKVLKDHYGVNLRVLPAKNDVSRLLPLVKVPGPSCDCQARGWLGHRLRWNSLYKESIHYTHGRYRPHRGPRERRYAACPPVCLAPADPSHQVSALA